MPSNEIFFSSKSSTHLFHNLVEEKCSDEQEAENPPVGVCVGRERQQSRFSCIVVVRDAAHIHYTLNSGNSHTLTTPNYNEYNKPCRGVSSSRLTDIGDSRAGWDAVQVILVPGGKLGGTVRWDDTE